MKAALLDDETDGLNALELSLRRHCPQIRSIHTFSDPVEALRQLPQLNPDILFTDIQMPEMDAFGVLERLPKLPRTVIFVTAHNQYAIKAFRFNALDYILKPIDEYDLQDAVKRAFTAHQVSTVQFDEARKQLSGQLSEKLAIPSAQGLAFVNLADILMVEANDHYSKLKLVDGRAHLLSKPIKEVRQTLEESHFLGIHRQYIVNLHHIRHFKKAENMVVLSNNLELPVARNAKDKLIQCFRML